MSTPAIPSALAVAAPKLSRELIVMAIQSGMFDGDLEIIGDVISRRRSAVAALKVSTLSIGQKVRVSDTVRPALLAGALCEVIGFEGRKVKVRLEVTRSSKWRAGNTVTLPPELVGDVL